MKTKRKVALRHRPMVSSQYIPVWLDIKVKLLFLYLYVSVSICQCYLYKLQFIITSVFLFSLRKSNAELSIAILKAITRQLRTDRRRCTKYRWHVVDILSYIL
jgi:hypothetical protein